MFIEDKQALAGHIERRESGMVMHYSFKPVETQNVHLLMCVCVCACVPAWACLCVSLKNTTMTGAMNYMLMHVSVGVTANDVTLYSCFYTFFFIRLKQMT